MDTTNPTIGNESATVTNDSMPPGPDEDLVQLTRCLSEAYTARGHIYLERGEIEMARSDLNVALRLDPGNTDADRLRGNIERHHPAGSFLSPTEVDGPGGEAASQPRTCFEAGYQVWTRFPDNPDRGGDLLETGFSPTPRGLQEAIEYARHMCSDESSRERGLLYDAYMTGGEEFDAVVVEYRSLAREVHLEKGSTDDDPEGELAYKA